MFALLYCVYTIILGGARLAPWTDITNTQGDRPASFDAQRKIKASSLNGWKCATIRCVADRMLNDSGLSRKEGVMAQKAAEKIKAMIKVSKNLRALAESTEWGVDLKTHDEKAFDIYHKN